jgi:hypothetical protein
MVCRTAIVGIGFGIEYGAVNYPIVRVFWGGEE